MFNVYLGVYVFQITPSDSCWNPVSQEDDDFFELLSSRLLVDPVHATKIRAAALRLLLACVSSWMVSGHG